MNDIDLEREERIAICMFDGHLTEEQALVIAKNKVASSISTTNSTQKHEYQQLTLFTGRPHP